MIVVCSLAYVLARKPRALLWCQANGCRLVGGHGKRDKVVGFVDYMATVEGRRRQRTDTV